MLFVLVKVGGINVDCQVTEAATVTSLTTYKPGMATVLMINSTDRAVVKYNQWWVVRRERERVKIWSERGRENLSQVRGKTFAEKRRNWWNSDYTVDDYNLSYFTCFQWWEVGTCSESHGVCTVHLGECHREEGARMELWRSQISENQPYPGK